MFNGIIQGVGQVKGIEALGGPGRRIGLAWSPEECCDASSLAQLRPGSSLAVNGACLTVCNVMTNAVEVDLSPRTMELTSFSRLDLGDCVNLESALRVGQAIEGHLLSGHIDGVGLCRYVEESGGSHRLSLELPGHLRGFLAENGSIAVNGVSLTTNGLTDKGCELTIVPFTFSHTVFGSMERDGQEVNIEVDLLARYVEQALKRRNALAG